MTKPSSVTGVPAGLYGCGCDTEHFRISKKKGLIFFPPSFDSAAIGKNSSVPTYFTNRALCYLKKCQWDLVIKDCKRALDLDPNLVKAHFFMGQALQVKFPFVTNEQGGECYNCYSKLKSEL